MTADDNFCTPSTVGHGWVDVSQEDLLQSQLFQAWHKDVDAEKKRQKHNRDIIGEANWPKLRKYQGVVISPLHETPARQGTNGGPEMTRVRRKVARSRAVPDTVPV